MSCNYSSIANFGPAAGMSAQNDPLSYCLVSGLESGFNHTIGGGNSLLGPESSQCQLYMAQYCAQNNDNACAYAFNDNNIIYPNTVASCNGPNGSCSGPGLGNGLTKGQFLLGNVAAEKYLVAMSNNCVRQYAPFDPSVAFSPMISKWVPSGNSCAGPGNCNAPNVCIPVYDVDAKNIDNDNIMDRILTQPWVAANVLINIYNYRMRSGRLKELANTKLGRYFASPGFQRLMNM